MNIEAGTLDHLATLTVIEKDNAGVVCMSSSFSSNYIIVSEVGKGAPGLVYAYTTFYIIPLSRQ